MIKVQALSPKRQQVITATDSTVLLGATPEGWGSPDSVWLDKMGIGIPKRPSLSLFLGHVFEPHIIAAFSERLGPGWGAPQSPGFMRLEDQPFGCTPDAMFSNELETVRFGFEAKSTTVKDDWGAEGTEEIPDRVYIQVQHSMMVTDASRWDVGMLLYDRAAKEEIACRVMANGNLDADDLDTYTVDQKFYSIERNEEFIEEVREVGTKFWNKYVIPKLRPSGEPAQQVAVKRDQSITPVVDDSIAESLRRYMELKNEVSGLLTEQEQIATKVKDQINALRAGGLISGGYQASLSPIVRKAKPDYELAFQGACAAGKLTEDAMKQILSIYRKEQSVSYRLDIKEIK